MDLMDVPQGYWIAHCVSADFALGAGIAKTINENFNMREMLNALWGKGSGLEDQWQVPCCLPCGNVFNLVTKERYYDKPTLETMRGALEDMAFHAKQNRVKKIAMPLIGCGLDKLEWNDVYAIILDIFKDIDIEILVCYL